MFTKPFFFFFQNDFILDKIVVPALGLSVWYKTVTSVLKMLPEASQPANNIYIFTRD